MACGLDAAGLSLTNFSRIQPTAQLAMKLEHQSSWGTAEPPRSLMSIALGPLDTTAQPELQHLKSVEFGRVAGIPLYFDAVIPEGPGPFPAAIIVHGGGWVRGDRITEVQPLFEPLTRAGIAWFSIDYRLSSDWTQFGAAIQDVQSAVRFIKGGASLYRVDPARIALIGESAGGQLASMAALDTSPETRVAAVVALYTPMDLVQLANSSASLVPQQLRDSLRGSPFEMIIMARLRQLSPFHRMHADAPPFLLIHGMVDRLIPFSQSQAMYNRMREIGVNCELYPVEGAGHGIKWWEGTMGPETTKYKRKIVAWLLARLSHQTA